MHIQIFKTRHPCAAFPYQSLRLGLRALKKEFPNYLIGMAAAWWKTDSVRMQSTSGTYPCGCRHEITRAAWCQGKNATLHNAVSRENFSLKHSLKHPQHPKTISNFSGELQPPLGWMSINLKIPDLFEGGFVSQVVVPFPDNLCTCESGI